MRFLIALGLCVCGPSACGASAPRTTLAVLPAAWRTADALPTLDERAPLLEALEQSGAVEARAADPEPACDAEDSECARAAGHRAGAEHAVLTSLAGLGETVVLRVTVLEVEGGTTEQTHQEVLHSRDEALAREALRALGARVAQPFTDSTASDTLVTVFSVGAAVAVAGVIALVIALAAETGPPNVDHVVVPP